MFPKLLSRLRAAWQVLRGVRPAEAQFDSSDHQIAQTIAVVTADRVFFELACDKDDIEAFEDGLWDVIHPRVKEAVYEAIREYVTYSRIVAAELAERREGTDGGSDPIPF